MFDAVLVAATCALGVTAGAFLVLAAVDRWRVGWRAALHHTPRTRRLGWGRNQTLIAGSLIMIPQLALLPFAAWSVVYGAFLVAAYALRRLRDQEGQ